MTEFKKLKKEEAKLLLKAIDKYNVPCNCCKEKVNENNFGIIHTIGICCNSILCQTELINKLEDDGEKNRLPINWRSNKEVVKLIKKEKKDSKENIIKEMITFVEKEIGCYANDKSSSKGLLHLKNYFQKMLFSKGKKVLCIGCGKPIHIDEFGGLDNRGLFHNNVFCLMKADIKKGDWKK